MIHGLDHLTLASDDVATTAAAYRDLFDRPTAAGARFQLANMALEIVPRAEAATTGLSAIAFAVADLGRACRLLDRRGLRTERQAAGGEEAAVGMANGLRLRFVERAPTAFRQAPAGADGAVAGLDHVVVRTPDPDRAIALFAGRLGLDMRLDRSFPDWGRRLIFFRCGDLVVEVAHDLTAGTGCGADSLWGLSWRIPGLEAAHARLAAQGMDLSDIRTGRRPGTRVFTTRNPALGVPTIAIGP